MEKKGADSKFDYNIEIKRLRSSEPAKMYLLHGVEDYLKEFYFNELKKKVIDEEFSDFSYRKFSGPELDTDEFELAVDTMPFMTERNFIELRDIDINKISDSSKLQNVIESLPDYCVVVWIFHSSSSLDFRLKTTKFIKDNSYELNFVPQSQDQMFRWIKKRFNAYGKTIDIEATQRLIFLCGDLMRNLIPEIEKISSYASSEKVSVSDVNAAAVPIPEAKVFDLTEFICDGDYYSAIDTLNSIAEDKDTEPIAVISLISNQYQRFYSVAIAEAYNLGSSYFKKIFSIKYDFIVRNLQRTVRNLSVRQIRNAINICGETDYKIKTSVSDPQQLLRECVIRIIADGTNKNK